MNKKKNNTIKVVKENNEKKKPTKIYLTEDQVRRLIEKLKTEIIQ